MNNGAKVYDPLLAGTSNALRQETGAGGGLIAGAGNFYSLPSKLSATQKPRWVSEVIDIVGLTGTLTIEITNDSDDEVRADTAKWTGFTPATAIPAIAGTARFGMSNLVPYGWYRTKFVRSAGAGSLESRRRTMEA